mmetsp:Transcript_47117/g.134935  ORF Transcript_47117/g.134935 Transcript_47117/m.134935 type:complete len:237 (-) Transcript_47117:194-904(-)
MRHHVRARLSKPLRTAGTKPPIESLGVHASLHVHLKSCAGPQALQPSAYGRKAIWMEFWESITTVREEPISLYCRRNVGHGEGLTKHVHPSLGLQVVLQGMHGLCEHRGQSGNILGTFQGAASGEGLLPHHREEDRRLRARDRRLGKLEPLPRERQRGRRRVRIQGSLLAVSLTEVGDDRVRLAQHQRPVTKRRHRPLGVQRQVPRLSLQVRRRQVASPHIRNATLSSCPKHLHNP